MPGRFNGVLQALHEDFARKEEGAGSSDRAFGLTFAAVGATVGVVRLWLGHDGSIGWLAGAAAFLVLSLLWTAPLRPLNRAWLRLGLLLHGIVNPVVLGVLFYGVIVPVGLLLRLQGKDLLRCQVDAGTASYWIDRPVAAGTCETMKNQF